MSRFGFLYLHLVGAVLLTGYALFWVVMAGALAVATRRDEAARLFGVVAATRWPPALLPRRWRLTLAGVGTAILAWLVATGGPLMHQGGPHAGVTGPALALKLGFVGLFGAGNLLLMVRPAPWLAYLNGFAALGTLVASAFLR